MTTRDPAVTEKPRYLPSRRALSLAGPGDGGRSSADRYSRGSSVRQAVYRGRVQRLGPILQASIILGSLLGLGILWPLRTSATHRGKRSGLGLSTIALLALARVNAAKIAYAELPVAVELLGLVFLFVLPVAWLVNGRRLRFRISTGWTRLARPLDPVRCGLGLQPPAVFGPGFRLRLVDRPRFRPGTAPVRIATGVTAERSGYSEDARVRCSKAERSRTAAATGGI